MSRTHYTETRLAATALSLQEQPVSEARSASGQSAPTSLQYLQLRQQVSTVNIQAIPKEEKNDAEATTIIIGPPATPSFADERKMLAATLAGIGVFGLLGGLLFPSLLLPSLFVASLLGVAALALGFGTMTFNPFKSKETKTDDSESEQKEDKDDKSDKSDTVYLRSYSSSTYVALEASSGNDKKSKAAKGKPTAANSEELVDTRPADKDASPTAPANPIAVT